MVKTIKDIDLEDRPREKLAKLGKDKLSDEELLAIILSTGTKNVNALELARQILDSFTPEELLEVDVYELNRINGIKLAKASKIVASIQLGKRLSKKVVYKKIKTISSSEDAYKYVRDNLEFRKKEHFYTIFLNSKNDIIATEEISIGDLTSTIVNPREVFRPAIKKSASSIIIIHNHPSGNPTPSKEDFIITNRLVECGKLLDIKVLDHLIIGNDSYYSFKKEAKMWGR